MRVTDQGADLLMISAGFAGALLVYNSFFQGGLSPYEMALGSGASILFFWAAMAVRRRELEAAGVWVGFIERFCLGTGVNLLIHAVLTYAFYIRRTPFLIAAGGFFSSILLTLRARSTGQRDRSRKRFLLIGFDGIAAKIFPYFSEPLIGAITAPLEPLPEGIPRLGNLEDAGEILRRYQPTNIVVSMNADAHHIPPALLLKYRLGGTTVEESSAIYERFFTRVCCERLKPVDLLLSSTLRGDSRTMAIQAVYTNLIGLALLVVLSPVMLLAAAAVALGSGLGPVLESFECAGFQYIPFRLLRFRTMRTDATGELTGPGRIISRLRLTNLPQLVNVVRGDMALIGPRPVRAEFARYLTALMPFYSHRFSVKPGILGWAQMHEPAENHPPDECRQIEYDLYYVKEGSLWMDAEIMIESPISRTRFPEAARK